MYIMIAVMGSCLTGARATSQAFLSLRVSISEVVGGARTATVDLEEECFCFMLSWQSIEWLGIESAPCLLPLKML
jgi:hypothetical protein